MIIKWITDRGHYYFLLPTINPLSLYPMKQIQLKLHIRLLKIKLSVRFPCLVSCSLKIQNEQVPFEIQAPLKVGQAVFEKSISHILNVPYDSEQQCFIEQRKMISILVYLKSASGRIPAGSAYIELNTLNTQLVELTLPIEKCPDKHATIDTSMSYEILNELQISASDVIKKFGTASNSGRKSLVASLIKKEPSRSKLRQEEDRVVDQRDYKMKMYQSKKSDKDQTSSPNRSKYLESGGSYQDQRKSMQSPRPYVQHQLKTRISDLQRQLKNSHKKQEQSFMQLRQANIKKELLQKNLRETQAQAKSYKQKYEDAHQDYQNHQRRNQFKDTSYKDQLKTLTDKLTASQAQKQRMIYQKNDRIGQFEEREKTLRLGLRDKQKQFAQEKVRLNKRIQQLIKQSDDAKNLGLDSQTKNSFLEGSITTLKNKIKQLEQTIVQEQLRTVAANELLSSEKLKRQELQQRLLENTSLEDQKKKIRKKLSDQDQQITKHLKTIASLQASLQRANARTDQTDQSVKQKTVALKNLQKQYENLIKQNDGLKRNLFDKERQLTDASYNANAQNTKKNNQINDLKERQRKLQQDLTKTKKDLSDKTSNLSSLTTQTKHMSQNLEKAKDQISIMGIQNADLKQQIENLQYQNENLSGYNKTYQNVIAEMKATNQANNKQVYNSQKKLKEQLSQKTLAIQDLQLKLTNIERTSTSQEEQARFEIDSLTVRIKEKQQQLATRNAELKKTKQILASLQDAKNKGDSRSQQLAYTLKLKENQITFLKESIQKANTQISGSTNQNKNLKNEIQKFKKDQQTLLQQVVQLQSIIEQQKSNGSQSNKTFQQYKAKNKAFLNAFLSKIKGGLIDYAPQHMEQDLVKSLKLAIENNNKYVTTQEKTIADLRDSLKTAHKDNKDRGTRIDELQKALSKEQNNNAQLNQNSGQTQAKMKAEIQALNLANKKLAEDSARQLKQLQTTLRKQIAGLNQQITAREKQIQTLTKQSAQLSANLQQKIKQFGDNQSQTAGKHQTQIATLKQKLAKAQQTFKKEVQIRAGVQKQFNALKKQHADLQRQSQSDNKKGGSEIQRLKNQVAKNIKDIEVRAAAQLQLKQKLEDSRKENQSLREINEAIRKRNEQGAGHQKELQATLAANKKTIGSLDKSVKERTNQLTQARQRIYHLQGQLKEAINLRDINKATIAVRDSHIAQKNEQVKKLTQKIKQDAYSAVVSQKQFASLQEKLKRQGSSLTSTLSSKEKELQQAYKKIAKLQTDFANQSTKNTNDSAVYSKNIKDLQAKNLQLNASIQKLTQSLGDKQKATATQENYLKPIRDHMTIVRGHTNQYMKAGDYFDASKNKLLKLISTRAEHPTQRFVGQNIKQISFAFNRLKVKVLGRQDIAPAAKEIFSNEVKSVQFALDRVLRAQK